jgi:hypothetical protein
VVYLYRVAYAESGMLSLAVLVITRALQPAVLASYWTFLFSAQVLDFKLTLIGAEMWLRKYFFRIRIL